LAGSTGKNSGGRFSGDGVNVETRFAYVEFGTPETIPGKFRVTMGLQPVDVNRYLWRETATGIKIKGEAGPAGLTFSWVRGFENFNNRPKTTFFSSADNFLIRADAEPMKDAKAGIFGLYQRRNPDVPTPAAANSVSYLLKNFGQVTYNIVDVGVDANVKYDIFTGGLDFIYQVGDSDTFRAGSFADLNSSAFLAHLDLGVGLGPAKLTYTGWYATGDDNPNDDDLKNFIATDVDITDSIIFFEGGYTDDNYFTEAGYFLNKGALFNKLALEFKPTAKLTLGVAGMYVMTAQSLAIGNGQRSRKLGTEIDAAITYKLNENLELGVNGGYLFSGDAMDAFETNQNGQADQNIFRSTGRARYTF
jgi:hypothetical protein